jgi:NAD(P)H-flavin reductase
MIEQMLPLPYRVIESVVENSDSVTLTLLPAGEALESFAPGQFAMVGLPGIGEVAISISGAAGKYLRHTVRDVGAVSHALAHLPVGAQLGVRGPFGTAWNPHSAVGADVLVVAGGVGLAPLRPVVTTVLGERAQYRRVIVVAGARTPPEYLFQTELDRWAQRIDVELIRTVDRPAPGWDGPVGLVTEPLASLALIGPCTFAFVCGPEPMMTATADTLTAVGVPAEQIEVSMERDMKCGVGVCGHCQLGPLLLCRDGAVVGWPVARGLLAIPEL